MTSPRLEYYKKLPAKRMASGVLFVDEQNRILILKTSYKHHWEIPGGVVEKNESPLSAAVREVKEEIGILLSPMSLKFLCVDYMAGNQDKTEALMFVFFGGLLTKQQIAELSPSSDEIVECIFAELSDASVKLGPTLGARVERSMTAYDSGTMTYFEGAY